MSLEPLRQVVDSMLRTNRKEKGFNRSVVHGFAHLALGGETGGPSDECLGSEAVLSLLLERLPAVPQGDAPA